jgi:glycosyltransferase involved in cell wall biosynthesis
MHPRLTIGLPVRNGEACLQEALDSILGQTFEDFELILSDNASTDRTRKICEACVAQDSRVRYVRHEEDQGAAGNFNFVVHEARGEYFKWASHDDRLLPTLLERSIAVMDADPEVALCHPRTAMIDGAGNHTRDFVDDLNLMHDQPHQRMGHLVTHMRLCNAVMGVMRTEVLRRTRLIDSFRSSDFITLIELSILGKFHEIEEHLYERRDHDDRILRKTKNEAEIQAWFNPAVKTVARYPGLKLLREQFRSISRLDLPTATAWKCRLAVGRWVIKRWRVTLGRWRRNLFGKKPHGHESAPAA